MTLSQTLDKLAKTLADKAADKDTPLLESIDAFKALTQYYAAQQKRARKSGDDEEPEAGGFSFADSTEVVNGEPRQRATIHSRRDS